MPVLITGGSGFVGLNIAIALLRKGEAVVLYDLNRPPQAAEQHLCGLGAGLAIVLGDVRDRTQLTHVIREHHIDRIVHGATITAGAQREIQQARLIADVNLGGTIEVLEAALACGISRVVQLGTGSVFGAAVPDVEQIGEDLPPVPDSLYGITKYAAERAAVRFRDKRGLNVVVGRVGVAFGPWEYDTGVRDTLSLPLQLLHVAQAGATARFRPGLPDDWIYATDVADAVVALLYAPSLGYDVYQIGRGRRWSVTDWCDRLRSVFPAFDYAIVEDNGPVNVGAVSANGRPPFSVERLRRDTGFSARFHEASAFDDYVKMPGRKMD